MKNIKLEDLQQRINASPNLQKMEAQLQAELLAQMSGVDDNNIAIDPFTILMLISVAIQVVQFCRERNKRDSDLITADMKSGHQTPLRRTIRLRRELNKMWLEYCVKNNLPHTAFNPFLAAVYAVGPQLDDATAAEFVQLASDF
jgi:hypothetical protein